MKFEFNGKNRNTYLATPKLVTGRENVPPIAPSPSCNKSSVSSSKRNGGSSHYNGLESSPSKRRISAIKGALGEGERKLLFTESTNNPPNRTMELCDLSMQDVDCVETEAPSQRAKSIRLKSKVGKVCRKVEPAKTRLKSRTKAGKIACGKKRGTFTLT